MKRNKGYIKALISVLVSIISMVLMGMMRKTVSSIPFINNILQFKNVGLDSIKDFLEVHELNLKIDEGTVNGESILYGTKARALYDGIKIVWNHDESIRYTLIISTGEISKISMMYEKEIKLLLAEEVDELKRSSGWTRKVIIDRKGDAKTYHYHVPFSKFYCRLKSDNGRVSNQIVYPDKSVPRIEQQEIKAWIQFERGQHYINVQESDEIDSGTIKDYQVLLYISDGRGLVKSLPKFKKSIKFKIGRVPPSLCFLTGTRNIGSKFEQYVGWIGEETSLTLNGILDYDPSEFDRVNNLAI